jgi:hypothetical protein
MSYKSNQEKMVIDSSGIVESVASATASTLITDLGSNNFRVNFSSRIIKQLTSADFQLVGCTIGSIVNNNQNALVTFSLTPTAASYSVKVISDVLSEFSESNTVSLTDIAIVSLNSGVAQEVDRVRFTATFNYPVTQTLTSSMVSASSGTVTNFSKAVDNLSVTFDVTTTASSFTVKTLAVSGATKESNLVSKSATNYWYSQSFDTAADNTPVNISFTFKTIGLAVDLVKSGTQNGYIMDVDTYPSFNGVGLYYPNNFVPSATVGIYNDNEKMGGPLLLVTNSQTPPAGTYLVTTSQTIYEIDFPAGTNFTGQFLGKLRTLGY